MYYGQRLQKYMEHIVNTVYTGKRGMQNHIRKGKKSTIKKNMFALILTIQMFTNILPWLLKW